MQKRTSSYARERNFFLAPVLLLLVSCSGSLPYWLNEEQKEEFLASVESMTPNTDSVRFYCPIVNDTNKDACYEGANFEVYTSSKTKDGNYSFKNNGSKAVSNVETKGTESAYEYGVSCLEALNITNAFSYADIIPFVKEAAKKTSGVYYLNDYPAYYFDIHSTVFESESFKSFRESHFNSVVNDAINEKGKLFFKIEDDFKMMGLGLGSVEPIDDKGLIITQL